MSVDCAVKRPTYMQWADLLYVLRVPVGLDGDVWDALKPHVLWAADGRCAIPRGETPAGLRTKLEAYAKEHGWAEQLEPAPRLHKASTEVT